MPVPKKFASYRDRFIEWFFKFFIKHRIKNILISRTFVALWTFLNRFYFEPQFKKERHHYIQRKFLRNFCVANLGRPNNRGEIYEYSNNNTSPARISIRKAASIPNYYSSRNINTGTNWNFVEKNLYANIVEKFGIIVVENILENKYSDIIPLEKYILALYVGFQYARTPAFDEQIKIYIYYLIKKNLVTKEAFSNKGKEEILNIFVFNSLNIDIKDVRTFYLSVNIPGFNLDSELSTILNRTDIKGVLSVLSTQIGGKLLDHLFLKELTILEAPEPYFFILPDTGVVVFDANDRNNTWPFGWDFKNNKIFVFLPISPQKCILFSLFEIDSNMHLSFIQMAITLSYKQRLMYVYSNVDNLLIQNNLLAN